MMHRIAPRPKPDSPPVVLNAPKPVRIMVRPKRNEPLESTGFRFGGCYHRDPFFACYEEAVAFIDAHGEGDKTYVVLPAVDMR